MKAPARVTVADGVERGARLSARTRARAAALAEALFTPEASAADAARIAWLVDELDDLCAHGGDQPRRVLVASLAAIDAAPPVVLGRLASFRALSIPDRVRLLERLERTGLGLALLGAKAMLSIVWHEHPESEHEIGVRRSRLGAHGGEVA